MIIVADTSPLNYLVLISQIDTLAAIYGEVVIPPAVQDELLSPSAPPPVREWICNPPGWLEVRTPSRMDLPLDPALDLGEREAITLAHTSGHGNILLIDERRGRHEAIRLGLRVAGTLGILEEAHRRGLLDLHTAIEKLLATNFKASDELLRRFIKRP